MAKKRREHVDLGGAAQGLTHNPFAALRRPGTPGAEGGGEPQASADVPAPEGSEPRLGSPGGRVELRRERKGRGGRTVTLVTWLRGAAPGAEALGGLARSTARALGVGAAVEGERLVVQGDQVERLDAHLRRTLGVEVVRGTDR